MSTATRLRILVVCSGNIGRSPLAEGLLRHALADRLGADVSDLRAKGIEVSSAGADAPEGHPASKRGMVFAAERGIDLAEHRATSLTAEMAEAADIIYGMDLSHIGDVGALSAAAVARTLLWEGKGSEIPDPHHESDEFFVAVGRRIEAALPRRVDEILAMRAERLSE